MVARVNRKPAMWGWLYSGFATFVPALFVFLLRREEIISAMEPKLKWVFQWVESPGMWTWVFFAFAVATCFCLGMQLRTVRKLRESVYNNSGHAWDKDGSIFAWLAVVVFGMLCSLPFLVGAALWMLIIPRIGTARPRMDMARVGSSWRGTRA